MSLLCSSTCLPCWELQETDHDGSLRVETRMLRELILETSSFQSQAVAGKFVWRFKAIGISCYSATCGYSPISNLLRGLGGLSLECKY